MTRRREADGFTLIEVLLVLSILALLVRIAYPAYDSFRRQAFAAQAAGDLNTVRAAALAQYEATGSYAADAPAGTMPAGMAPYLPARFSFVRPVYELDWEHYTVADSSAGGAMTGHVVALTVTAADSLVGLQVLRTLGANCAHWSAGTSHTFVLFSTVAGTL